MELPWWGSLRQRWSAQTIALAVFAVLVIRLLVSTRIEFAYVLASPDYRAEAMRNAAVMRAEAATVAAMPGPVACSNLVLCRMAGKPFVYDHFYATQIIATGRMTATELKARLAAAGIHQVVNDERTTAPSLYRRWLSHQGS